MKPLELDSPRRRTDRCLSDLVLDRIRDGELADRRGDQDHLASCESCSERLDELTEAHSEAAGDALAWRRMAERTAGQTGDAS